MPTEAPRKRVSRHGPNREVALVAQGRPYATPTTLTDELADKIAAKVAIGDRPYVAALLCDVPKRTYFMWIEKGEADALDALDTIYARLVHKVEVAQAKAEHSRVVIMAAAARARLEPAGGEGQVRIPGDWKAALAWLSRSRDGWQERRELTGKDGSPLFGATGFEGMGDDEINERLHALQERRRAPCRAGRATAPRRARTKARST